MSNLVYPIYKLPEFKLQGITPWSKWWLIKKSRGSSGLTEETNLPTKYNYYFKDFQIEGNSLQKTYEGYNKIGYFSGVTQTKNGITAIVNDDGSITFNGTCNADIGDSILALTSARGDFLNFEVPAGITLSAFYVTGTISYNNITDFNFRIYTGNWGYGLYLDLTDLNAQNNYKFNVGTTGSTGTFSRSNTLFRCKQGVTFNNFTIKIMLSDTKQEKYEPYVGGIASPNPEYPQEIKSAGDNGYITEKVQNKNWFDKYSFIENPDKNFDDDGNIKTSSGWSVSNYIMLDSNKPYTISGTIVPNNWVIKIVEYDKSYNIIKLSKNTWRGSYSFTTTNTTKYIRFTLSKNDSVPFYYDINTIQIEEGTTSTTYVPHAEQNLSIPTQEPLKQVGNFRDRFINISGQWFEEHTIKRKYFDGTESGVLFNGVFYTIIQDYLREYNEKTVISNYFEGIKNPYGINDMPEDKDNFCCFRTIESDNLKYFYITSKQFTSIQSFQSWLAEKDTQGNPVYIDYVLDEPYLLPCTDEQTEELNKITKLRTYIGGTNITSKDEVPANIVVEYVGSPIVQGEEIMTLNEESEVEENDI